MNTIQAIYENGVFRPLGPVELPEQCQVEITPKVIGSPQDPAHKARVHEILSRRHESGQHDIAERHNEHQP